MSTTPVARSTRTSVTPAIAASSDSTALTQWPQVMPSTVTVVVMVMVCAPASVVR